MSIILTFTDLYRNFSCTAKGTGVEMRPQLCITDCFNQKASVGTPFMLNCKMLTIHDVAEQLNELRAIKVGKEWRVAETDLDAYVAGHANFGNAQ